MMNVHCSERLRCEWFIGYVCFSTLGDARCFTSFHGNHVPMVEGIVSTAIRDRSNTDIVVEDLTFVEDSIMSEY